jgi:hypothetical protein
VLLDTEDTNEEVAGDRPEPLRGASKGKIAAFAAAGMLVAAVLFVSGLLVGQSLRMSDAEAANQRNAAVSAAVVRTERDTERTVVAEQEGIRRKAIREARTAQKKHDRTVMRQLRRKLAKSADRQAEQSFASGQSTGYSSGHAEGSEEGYETGLTDGSDDLTCSDDPDVYWLPACY